MPLLFMIDAFDDASCYRMNDDSAITINDRYMCVALLKPPGYFSDDSDAK